MSRSTSRSAARTPCSWPGARGVAARPGVRRRITWLTAWALVVLRGSPAAAATALEVNGVVFADHDGDGRLSPDEQPVSGVAVAIDTHLVTQTDADGRFHFVTPRPGHVWVRIPDGYDPGPVWHRVGGDAPHSDLAFPLRPSRARGPVHFVHASDTQIEDAVADTARSFQLATGPSPPLHFAVVTGDLVSHSLAAEYDAYHESMHGIAVPVVPVVGNHDWHDAGREYQRRYGPTMYSFDSGGVHFIVLDYLKPAAYQIDFIRRDTAWITDRRPVVAFSHAPLTDAMAQNLTQRGVRYAFTGHYHSNAVLRHGSLVEYSTEPLVFGGIDYTPAGYRTVRRVADELVVDHHTVTRGPIAQLVAPAPSVCVPPGPVDIVAAIEIGHQPARASVTIGDAPPVAMTPVGGWNWMASGLRIQPGDHRVELIVEPSSGEPLVDRSTLCVASSETQVDEYRPPGDPWPQLQGDGARSGSRAIRLPPPLASRWSRPVGGHIRGGPAVTDDAIYVPVTDLGAGDAGGVVALSAATGRLSWRYRAGVSVPNTPAVAGDVVVALAQDGTVHAVDRASGRAVWRADLGAQPPLEVSERWMYAAPAICAGRVFAALKDRVVALDLATGRTLWQLHVTTLPIITVASSACDEDLGVSVVGRNTLVAWDPATGEQRWVYAHAATRPVHATPSITDDAVLLVDPGYRLVAVDRAGGTPLWATPLPLEVHPRVGDEVVASPIRRGRHVVIATPAGPVLGLDGQTGAELWRARGGESLVHPYAYRMRAGGFAAAPVGTGDVLWIGGVDGVLRALDLTTGEERWSRDFAVPILAAPVPSGPHLYVATYDGTVHALVTEAPEAMVVATAELLYPSHWSVPALVAAIVGCDAALVLWLLWRRRRNARAANA